MTGAPGLLRVGVESGEGLVARFGDTVVLVVGEDDDETEHLLDAVPTAASGGTAGRIAGGLARWVAGRPDEERADRYREIVPKKAFRKPPGLRENSKPSSRTLVDVGFVEIA